MDAYQSFRRPFIASEVSKSPSVTEWLTQNGTNSAVDSVMRDSMLSMAEELQMKAAGTNGGLALGSDCF